MMATEVGGERRPEGWVPVERRWLGLDRGTIAPALIVLALAVVMQFALPAINNAIPFTDKVKPGDVMELAGGITFVPAVGWGITSGVRAGQPPASGSFPPKASVESGGVTFSVLTGDFDGDAQALLRQIEKTTDVLNGKRGFHIAADPIPIRTSSGIEGALARYSGSVSEGAVAALTVDGTGIQVVVTGPPQTPDELTAQVGEMITSVGQR